MSLWMKLAFIVAFMPLVVVSVYGLAIESQPVFVAFSLWAVGVTFLMLVGYLIFGGKRANKAQPCRTSQVQEAAQEVGGYEPAVVNYPRGLRD